MNITQDLSIIELVMNASAVVKLVMALLTVVSVMSWYWIFRKAFAIRDARVKTEKFEREFWSGGDLNTLYQSAVNDRHHSGALERVFEFCRISIGCAVRSRQRRRRRPEYDNLQRIALADRPPHALQ